MQPYASTLVIFCLVLLLGTGHCLAKVCVNYLEPVTTVIIDYKTGSKELIPRACWKDSDKWYQLIDVNPLDGTADGWDTEDMIGRTSNVIFEAFYDYQIDVCEKNKDSEYCCEKGVKTFNALEKRGCWLREGESSYLQGKRITTKSRDEKGQGFVKESYVFTYICNGEEDYKDVAITYDAYYSYQCATPDDVW